MNFPPGWQRLQSPKTHIQSYHMQEFARASILTPVLLRRWLSPEKVENKFLNAIERIVRARTSLRFNGVESIVHCYASMAKSNAVIVAPTIRIQDRKWIMSLGIEGRQRYQDLLQAAAEATQRSHMPLRCKQTLAQIPVLSSRLASVAPSSAASQISGPMQTEPSVGRAQGIDEEEMVGNAMCGSLGGDNSSPQPKKSQGFLRLRQTPNVHSILHYMDVAIEYGSPRNVLTFLGEDKHSYVAFPSFHSGATNIIIVITKAKSRRQIIEMQHKHCLSMKDGVKPYDLCSLDHSNRAIRSTQRRCNLLISSARHSFPILMLRLLMIT